MIAYLNNTLRYITYGQYSVSFINDIILILLSRLLFIHLVALLIEGVWPRCLLQNALPRKWVADLALKLVILFDSKIVQGSFVYFFGFFLSLFKQNR